MTYARVDLPEPLGPMMAWVWPDSMVRSTPLRISAVSGESSVAATRAVRPLISRVVMGVARNLCMRSWGKFWAGSSDAGGLQLQFDGLGDPLAHLRHADTVDHLAEEPADHET